MQHKGKQEAVRSKIWRVDRLVGVGVGTGVQAGQTGAKRRNDEQQ